MRNVLENGETLGRIEVGVQLCRHRGGIANREGRGYAYERSSEEVGNEGHRGCCCLVSVELAGAEVQTPRSIPFYAYPGLVLWKMPRPRKA